MNEPTARQRAKRRGERHYEGPDCKLGHGGKRYVANGTCVECTKMAVTRSRHHARERA